MKNRTHLVGGKSLNRLKIARHFEVSQYFFFLITSDSSRLVPDDSYLLDFLDVNDKAFNENLLRRVYVILKNIDLSQKDTHTSTYKLIAAIENAPWDIPSTIEWLSIYDKEYLPSKNLSVNNLTKTEYYDNLRSFANDSVNAYWDSEIVYNYNDDDSVKNIDFSLFILI